MSWSPKTGQVVKRESPALEWPKGRGSRDEATPEEAFGGVKAKVALREVVNRKRIRRLMRAMESAGTDWGIQSSLVSLTST
jgi:hypothetical protein